MSVEREAKILAELILGEDVEVKLAEQALRRLKVKAENGEAFQEAIVTALDELVTALDSSPIPGSQQVFAVAETLSQALLLATEDVPRSPSEILTENLPDELETVHTYEPVKDGVHTIPVPKGWSIEQSWEAVSRGEGLPAEAVEWVRVEVKDGKMTRRK